MWTPVNCARTKHCVGTDIIAVASVNIIAGGEVGEVRRREVGSGSQVPEGKTWPVFITVKLQGPNICHPKAPLWGIDF